MNPEQWLRLSYALRDYCLARADAERFGRRGPEPDTIERLGAQRRERQSLRALRSSPEGTELVRLVLGSPAPRWAWVEAAARFVVHTRTRVEEGRGWTQQETVQFLAGEVEL